MIFLKCRKHRLPGFDSSSQVLTLVGGVTMMLYPPFVCLFLSFLSLHNAIRPRGHSRHVALSKKSKYVNRMRLNRSS